MSLILRCPVCEKHYEANDDVVKQETLRCPLCSTEAAASDFSAMMFCPHCRGKLAVSLDMLTEANLSCPRCEKTFIPTINISLDDDDDEDMSLFADDNEDKSSFNEGDFFDKYKIIRLLGRGGMGEVYLAEHLFLHREVALKIMLSDVAKNSVFAKRFVREAKIANKIESPNLIGVFDVGIENQTEMLFIAMEYVNGKNVSELIRENGVFDEQTTLNIAYNVVNALEAMEKENVVHRDIKPSNIMIDFEGNIKLADLGIAKSNNHAEGDLTLTQDSVVFGTPNYASPEQCRSSHHVDSRSDIYSLGATMFQMVTGEAPYNGETGMEIMLKVLGDETPDFDKLKGMSAGFTALLYDMMQKDPDKRPQNITELKERIEKLLEGETIWKYKLRIMLKKALPIVKSAGLAILKAPLVIFKKRQKNDSAIRHFCNFITFCILLVLLGSIAYKYQDKLGDLWMKYIEEVSPQEMNTSKEQQKRVNNLKIIMAHRQEQKRMAEWRRKNDADSAGRKSTSYKSVKKVYAPEVKQTESNTNTNTNINTNNISNSQPLKTVTVPEKKQPKVNAINYDAVAESSKLAESESAIKKSIRHADYPQTIEGRLAWCNDVIAELKKELAQNPDNKWLKERLDFMEKTVKVNIQKQENNRQRAEKLKNSGRFDERANSEIKSLYRSAAQRVRYYHYGSGNDRETTEKLHQLQRLLHSRNFDPNISVEDPVFSHEGGPLIKALLKHRFITEKMAESMIELLLKRYVIIPESLINNHYIMLCKENILRYGLSDYDRFWYYCLQYKQNYLSLLTELGADVNFKYRQASMLHWAVTVSDFDTVKKMLLAGADISAVDENGQTPLFRAEKYASEAVVRLLTALGSDTEYCDNSGKKASDYRYYNDFNNAVRKNHYDTIMNMLDKHPELANEMLYNGSYPLYYAVAQRNIPLVKKLLAMKADVFKDTVFNTSNTMTNLVMKIMMSARNNSSERSKCLQIYKLLLAAGAKSPRNFNIFSRINYMKIDNIAAACLIETAKYVKTEEYAAWILAALYSSYSNSNLNNSNVRYDVVKSLLKYNEYDLSSQQFKYVFIRAASNVNVQERELNLLLSCKADVNSRGNDGMTALFKLCLDSQRYSGNFRPGNNMPSLNDYVKRIRYLLNNHAKVDVVCNGRTIADLNLPPDIRNIYQIRRFLKQKGR